jgi:cellulose synthase/poly-beta-1,6-N-acetylglucosamine synthase-like glycosyltransferase
MRITIEACLWIMSFGVLVPAVVLFVQCAVASRGRASVPRAPSGARPRSAVLVPAHNEGAVIEGTLRAISAQLESGDRVVVVADNCDDETAEVARSAGAEVVERRDPLNRGKGHALDYGVRHLAADPPEAVVVIDADCTLHGGSLDSLVRLTGETGRPAQSRNVVAVPAGGGSPIQVLSAFAFLVRNIVRPTGMARLGLPCPLMGTGMAFPWHTLQAAPLASGSLAEDLELGCDLALAGHPPMFCPTALVTSHMPGHRRARDIQRRRWEQGHLAAAFSRAPRLLAGAVAQRRLDLALLAMDLCVPPLSLLIWIWAASAVAACLGWVYVGLAGPVLVLSLGGGLLLAALLMAWYRFGRDTCPPTVLLAAPVYLLKKAAFYGGLLLDRERNWVRTHRDS